MTLRLPTSNRRFYWRLRLPINNRYVIAFVIVLANALKSLILGDDLRQTSPMVLTGSGGSNGMMRNGLSVGISTFAANFGTRVMP